MRSIEPGIHHPDSSGHGRAPANTPARAGACCGYGFRGRERWPAPRNDEWKGWRTFFRTQSYPRLSAAHLSCKTSPPEAGDASRPARHAGGERRPRRSVNTDTAVPGGLREPARPALRPGRANRRRKADGPVSACPRGNPGPRHISGVEQRAGPVAGCPHPPVRRSAGARCQKSPCAGRREAGCLLFDAVTRRFLRFSRTFSHAPAHKAGAGTERLGLNGWARCGRSDREFWASPTARHSGRCGSI
jgi:hypothetical protein